MGTSLLRATSRLFVPVVAVALLAGVSQDALALFDPDQVGEDGRLVLQTGKDLGDFHFSLQSKNGTAWQNVTVGTSTTVVRQGFGVQKGCTIVQTGPELARLTAFRNTSSGDLGYVATSLGVYDGPQGTACGRVSKSKSETISFAVGSATELKGANAFDRLELDLEVKGSVTLELKINFDGAITTYTLKAGASIDPALLNDGMVFGPKNPEKTFYCRASSDSGPDSGPSDNCRWIIEDLGRSFTIEPLEGEFSLEGGGDFFGEPTERSFIYLTSIDGYLECDRPITTSGDGIQCDATRLDAPGEVCTKVPYVFRATSDDQRQYCILEADMGTQQLIVNIFTSYDKEPQKELPSGTSVINLETWESAPLSQIRFDTGTDSYPIPPCLGLTLTGMDLPANVGPDPIAEVIPQVIDGVKQPSPYDRVSGNSFVEFSCAFLREESFGSDETPSGYVNWTRIREGIQFWGDPQLSRPGGGVL